MVVLIPLTTGELDCSAAVPWGSTNGLVAALAGAELGELDVMRSLTKDGWGDTVTLTPEPGAVSIVLILIPLIFNVETNCVAFQIRRANRRVYISAKLVVLEQTGLLTSAF
jgi:hypothetical protein